MRSGNVGAVRVNTGFLLILNLILSVFLFCVHCVHIYSCFIILHVVLRQANVQAPARLQHHMHGMHALEHSRKLTYARNLTTQVHIAWVSTMLMATSTRCQYWCTRARLFASRVLDIYVRKFLCDSSSSVYISMDIFVSISLAACVRSMLMPTIFSALMKTSLDHFSRFTGVHPAFFL